MVTLDEYATVKDGRDSARAQVVNLGSRLRQVADLLQNPERVRVNEQTIMRVGRSIPHVLDESELPTWSQIADALRSFHRAEDGYLVADSSLSPDQRRHVKRDR